MPEILDQQLWLHDAAGACELALLRAAGRPGAEDGPIVGDQLGRERIVAALTPALDLVWPGWTRGMIDDEGLEAFLRNAYGRIVKGLDSLSSTEDFVPAALWRESVRELLLEHLRAEVEALIGGVHAEGLWFAFDSVRDTSALVELIQSGMLIKLRLVGAFLLGSPSRYDDELTAAQFFTAGTWKQLRDNDLAAAIAQWQLPVHKDVAHLTVSRPLPEERGVHLPNGYRHLVLTQAKLIVQFGEAVDERLVPGWWGDWIGGLVGQVNADLGDDW